MSTESIFQAKTPLDMTHLFFLDGDIRASRHITTARPDYINFSCSGVTMEFFGCFEYSDKGRVSGELTHIIQYKESAAGGREVVFEWIGSAGADMIYKMFQGNALFPYGAVSYLLTGDDIIKGSPGNDVLTGGAGNDYIVGGGGRDVFLYQLTGNGIDTIADAAVGSTFRVVGSPVTGVRTRQEEGVTVLIISTEAAPHTPIVVNLIGHFTADRFLIRGHDVVITGKSAAVVQPAPVAAVAPEPSPPVAASGPAFSETTRPDLSAAPSGEIWHLMTALIQARQGHIAPGGKARSLNRQQVEALWDNLINGWSIGLLVAVDTTGAETMPWPTHFGPWAIQSKPGKRIRLIGGAEKIVALAWSLTDPGTLLRHHFSAEEKDIWSGQTLVVDAGLRRVGFVKGPPDSRRQLPVWLLPQARACLDAMNQMDLAPVEREWLNRAARRLLEARVTVHLFPVGEQDGAQRMVGNFRQLGL